MSSFSHLDLILKTLHKHSNRQYIPAASIKALLRRKVSSGSGRFLRKSLRTPVITLISSTLLSGGRVFPLIIFSFSSFTMRSWPETLYRPTWAVEKTDESSSHCLAAVILYYYSMTELIRDVMICYNYFRERIGAMTHSF